MVTEPATTTETMDLVGGNVAFDFANTASEHGAAGPRVERLHTYRDLVVFARRTGLLDGARAERLLRDASARPAAAANVLARAVGLRECIYRVFAAVAKSAAPAAPDVRLLNEFLAEGLPHRRLEPGERGYGWRWSEGEEPLAQMLWPIVHAAAEQLVEGEAERVKLCGNDTCAWLFLDVSRNRSRRWCDMKDCGNRAKARRHYARRKQGESS